MTRRKRVYAQTVPPFDVEGEEKPEVVWQTAPQYENLPPRDNRIRNLFLGGGLVLLGMMAGRYVDLNGLTASPAQEVPAEARVGREWAVKNTADPKCTEYTEWVQPVEFPPGSGKTVNVQMGECTGSLLYVPPTNQVR